MQSYFCLEGLISACSYIFWRRLFFCQAAKRLHFFTRVDFFFDLQFSRAWFVMSTLLDQDGNNQAAPLSQIK